MTRRQRRSLRDYLADPGHWAGWSNDPADMRTGTAWLKLGRLQVYVWVEPECPTG